MTQPAELHRIGKHTWAGFGRAGNHAVIETAGGTLLVNLGPAEPSAGAPDRVVATDATACLAWRHRLGPDATLLVSDQVAAELSRQAPGETPPCDFGHQAILELGPIAVELRELGPGFADGNTVVWVPAEGTLITGDLICASVHPAASCGLPGAAEAWHAACQRLIALRPDVVLPGRGPVMDLAGIADFRDYLEHLILEVGRRFDRGLPVEETAVDLPLARWRDWAHPENLAVTVAALYRGLGAPPMSRAAAETVATEIAGGLRPRPRIAPLAAGDRDGRAAEVLVTVDGEQAIFDLHRTNLPNIHTTLVRHPDLYEQTVPIARGVVSGVLEPRDRELSILRGAWNCRAMYQWSHHRQVALGVGLTAAEIDLLSHDLERGTWTRHELAVLLACDELHATATVTDPTWAVLAERLSTQQLIELVTLIGEYHKVSFQLNAWRVPVEAWVGPITLPTGWPAPPA